MIVMDFPHNPTPPYVRMPVAFGIVVYHERVPVHRFFATPVRVHRHDTWSICWLENIVGAKISEDVAIVMQQVLRRPNSDQVFLQEESSMHVVPVDSVHHDHEMGLPVCVSSEQWRSRNVVFGDKSNENRGAIP
jgi:hypothetical protein